MKIYTDDLGIKRCQQSNGEIIPVISNHHIRIIKKRDAPNVRYFKKKLFSDRNSDYVMAGDEVVLNDEIGRCHNGIVTDYNGIKIDCFNQTTNKHEYFCVDVD